MTEASEEKMSTRTTKGKTSIYLSSVTEDDEDAISISLLLMSFGFDVIPRLWATTGEAGSGGDGGGGGGGGETGGGDGRNEGMGVRSGTITGLAIDRQPEESWGRATMEFQVEVGFPKTTTEYSWIEKQYFIHM